MRNDWEHVYNTWFNTHRFLEGRNTNPRKNRGSGSRSKDEWIFLSQKTYSVCVCVQIVIWYNTIPDLRYLRPAKTCTTVSFYVHWSICIRDSSLSHDVADLSVVYDWLLLQFNQSRSSLNSLADRECNECATRVIRLVSASHYIYLSGDKPKERLCRRFYKHYIYCFVKV